MSDNEQTLVRGATEEQQPTMDNSEITGQSEVSDQGEAMDHSEVADQSEVTQSEATDHSDHEGPNEKGDGKKVKGKKGQKKPVRLNKDGKRQKKKAFDSYATYIHRVLKQVHPDVGMTSKSMNIMDCFVKDFFDKIATQGADLLKHSKKVTFSGDDVQAATRLILPGELWKHAVAEGTKALSKYKATLPPPKPKKSKKAVADE